MYIYSIERVKIKEYSSKVYYPFYFDENKYESIIKKYRESKIWTNLDESEVNARKNELLQDVANYLFCNCNNNSTDSVCVFKMKKYEEIEVSIIDHKDILCNLSNLQLIDGNQKTIFGIKGIELLLFSDGIGILTFIVELGDDTNQITSPNRILRFNKMFKIDNTNKSNVIFYKQDGTKEETNLRKIIESILFESICEHKDTFYERGFINLRFVRFENYKTSEEFKNSTFGFMYYLMNMFNDSDIIEVPDDFSQSQVYMPQANIAHFFTLKGGGVFVYDNGDSFIESGRFRKNVMNNYSIGMTLALYQRIIMLKFAKDLTNVFLNNENDKFKSKRKNKAMLQHTEKILEKFRCFTAKCWFKEISNIEWRNNFFKNWQKCFGLECLFQQIREEIQDINEYFKFVEYRSDEKLKDNQNYVMAIITLFFIPLNLFVGFMGMNVQSLGIESMNIKTTMIYLCGVTLICWLIVGIIYGIIKLINFAKKKLTE